MGGSPRPPRSKQTFSRWAPRRCAILGRRALDVPRQTRAAIGALDPLGGKLIAALPGRSRGRARLVASRAKRFIDGGAHGYGSSRTPQARIACLQPSASARIEAVVRAGRRCKVPRCDERRRPPNRALLPSPRCERARLGSRDCFCPRASAAPDDCKGDIPHPRLRRAQCCRRPRRAATQASGCRAAESVR